MELSSEAMSRTAFRMPQAEGELLTMTTDRTDSAKFESGTEARLEQHNTFKIYPTFALGDFEGAGWPVFVTLETYRYSGSAQLANSSNLKPYDVPWI